MSDTMHLVDARERYVRKANAIIQKSRFSLNLQQQKIVLYLISQIDASDKEFKEYSFSIPDFCRIVGIDETSGKNYADLKHAIQEIRNKSMWIELESGKHSLVSWIEKARIVEGTGTIQIRLDDDLKPFLLELKRNFTSYQLIFTLHFKSKYSIRMYELFSSLQYDKDLPYKVTYSIDDLKERLDATTYKQYTDLRARVIIPAVNEINEYSDRTIEYREIKQGRKVVELEFIIRTKSTIERLKILDKIDKDLGTNQLALY